MNRLFDNMEVLPESLENIDEATVYAQTGVSYDRIDRAVKAELGLTKSKKHLSKRITLTLIAAVVGAAMLGTIGVGAMGGFNQAFGERFAGEKVNGIYAGGNVDIKTNDNVQAELLGIAGDYNQIMAAVTVKKTDGTPFVPYEDLENTMVAPSLYGNCLDENGNVLEQLPFALTNSSMRDNKNDYDYINVSTSAWTRMQFHFGDNYQYSWRADDGTEICRDDNDYDMRLTDPYTAKMIYHVGREHFSLTGETMSVHQKELYILHKDEVLAEDTVNIHIMDDGEPNDDYEHFFEVLEHQKKVVADNKDRLKNNQTIFVQTDRDPFVNYNNQDNGIVKRTIYVVTVDKVTIDFEGSWKLNYKPTSINLAAADDLQYGGIPYRISNLKAGTFYATMTISTDSDLSAYKVHRSHDFFNDWSLKLLSGDTKITMKNGDTLKGVWYVPYSYEMMEGTEAERLMGYPNGETFTAQLIYYQYNDYNNLTVWSNLNPEEIASITIDGTEILQ